MEHIGTVSGTVIQSDTGEFFNSLSVSGIAVNIGGGITSLNSQTGDIVIAGVGTSTVTTVGGAITVSGSLRVRETDSDPLVNQVTEIVVTTGTLTDLGGGVVQIDTGGSAGGGADVDQLQNTLYGQAFVA